MVIIDDDDAFRESLELNLLDEGFVVTSFPDGRSGLDFLGAGGGADVILLDWRMPGISGLDVLRELRRRGITIPVIFLTALTDDVYEETALDGGAVDFVDKAKRLSIVVRRIRLIIEGARPAELPAGVPEIVLRGPLELRFDISRASWRGQVVELTLTEFRICAALASRTGEDVSYREIYDLVHGEGFVAGYGQEGYRANVRTFIKRIRKKFREVDPGFEQIDNYAGFGYRWIA